MTGSAVTPETVAAVRAQTEAQVKQARTNAEQTARTLLGDAALNARAAGVAGIVVPLNPDRPLTADEKLYAAALVVNDPRGEGPRAAARYITCLDMVAASEPGRKTEPVEQYFVPPSEEMETQYAIDQLAGAAQMVAQAVVDGNRASMVTSLRDRRQVALDLADALEQGTATPAQQRQALALCLRGMVRLGRLHLNDLDAAP